MTIFTLSTDLTLPLPIEQVFPFFSDAGNLEAITPPFLYFKILTPRPIPMHPGALIEYRLRLHGLPFRWKTQIETWEPPHRFTDKQLKGPYRLWHHTHTFESTPRGTRVRDHVRYAVLFGAPVQRLFVKPQIDTIFRYRQAAITRLLLGRELPDIPPPVHGSEA